MQRYSRFILTIETSFERPLDPLERTDLLQLDVITVRSARILNGDGRHRLVFELIRTFRQHQFQRIGIDERRRDEQKQQQQEHQVGHRRCRKTLIDFRAVFDCHNRLSLNGLIQNIHKCDGIGLHLEHQLFDASDQIVVAEIGRNTDQQTHHGRHHRDIHTARQQSEIDRSARSGHIHESLHHAEHSTEETDHRRTAGYSR